MRKGFIITAVLALCAIAPVQAQFPLPPPVNLGGGTASPRAKVLLREADQVRNDSRKGTSTTPAKSSPKKAPAAPVTSSKGKSTTAQAPSSPDHTAPQKIDTWNSGTSLHELAAEGKVEEIKAALKGGASLKIRDKDGGTVLHSAVGKGQLEVVQFLLTQDDVDVNAQESRGLTAAMLAAARDDVASLQALIAKGADLNVASNDGSTALHRAAAAGRANAVRALLAGGADPLLLDKKGRKASEVAAKTRQNDWSYAVDLLEQAEKKKR